MGRVFIFGAGSSRAVCSTAPLNNELLPGVLQLRGALVTKRVKQLNQFIRKFYSLPEGTLPRLEDMLSQLDLAISEGRPLSPEYTLQKLRELRENLILAVAELLRRRLGQTSAHPAVDTSAFFRTLVSDDSIVSLNYDIILDNALLRYRRSSKVKGINYGIGIRYAFDIDGEILCGRHRYPEALIDPPIYKPHGSLNWLYCPVCGKLDVTRTDRFTGGKAVPFLLDDQRPKCWDCFGPYEALIITPTLFKAYNNSLLLDVWREIETRLSVADEVLFIGYSLPDADIHLRCMLSRAIFRNRSRALVNGPTIRVIGLEREHTEPQDYYRRTASDTHRRYMSLFGEVDYDPTGFEGYVGRGCRTFHQNESLTNQRETGGLPGTLKSEDE